MLFFRGREVLLLYRQHGRTGRAARIRSDRRCSGRNTFCQAGDARRIGNGRDRRRGRTPVTVQRNILRAAVAESSRRHKLLGRPGGRGWGCRRDRERNQCSGADRERGAAGYARCRSRDGHASTLLAMSDSRGTDRSKIWLRGFP